MVISDFLVLAITSGLVAGIISTIGNIVITIYSERKKEKLERVKYRYTLNDFRYNKLHENLIEIVNLTPIVYGINTKGELLNTIKQSNKHFEKIMAHYNIIIPLLDKDLVEKLEQQYVKVNEISSDGIKYAYGHGEIEKWDVTKLIKARNVLENIIVEIIQKQLKRIIQKSK